MNAFECVRVLSDAEYNRLKDIAERYKQEGTPPGTAFDVGYLIAMIFRFKDRLERPLVKPGG